MQMKAAFLFGKSFIQINRISSRKENYCRTKEELHCKNIGSSIKSLDYDQYLCNKGAASWLGRSFDQILDQNYEYNKNLV